MKEKDVCVLSTVSKDDANKRDRFEALLLKQHPHLKDFVKNPNAIMICIKVQSLRLLDGLTDSHFVNLTEI